MCRCPLFTTVDDTEPFLFMAKDQCTRWNGSALLYTVSQVQASESHVGPQAKVQELDSG